MKLQASCIVRVGVVQLGAELHDSRIGKGVLLTCCRFVIGLFRFVVFPLRRRAFQDLRDFFRKSRLLFLTHVIPLRSRR